MAAVKVYTSHSAAAGCPIASPDSQSKSSCTSHSRAERGGTVLGSCPTVQRHADYLA